MIVTPVLLLFLRMLPVSASQTVLGESSGCLSANSADSTANYQACCSSGQTGRESIDGITYEYRCGSYATGPASARHNVGSAGECARLCSIEPNCPASMWRHSRRTCWLATDQNYDGRSSPGWLLLARKSDISMRPTAGTDGDCSEIVRDKVAQCERDADGRCKEEKAVLERELAEAKKEAAAAQKEATAAKQKASDMEKDSSTSQEKIAEVRKEAAAAQQKLAEAEQKLTDAEKKLAEAEKKTTDAEKKAGDAAKAASEAKEKADVAEKRAEEAEKKASSGGSGLSGFPAIDPENKNLDTRDICPKFHGKEFKLPTPDGNTTLWRVYCDHVAYEIIHNAYGWMGNFSITPYNTLVAHRHWDAGYRAFYWRDTDFLYRHLTTYQLDWNTKQSMMNAFHITRSPGSRHHVIARIDDNYLKVY